MTAPAGRPSVERVRAAFEWAGSNAEIVTLTETARSAREATDSLGVALGVIVKSPMFAVGGQPAMALAAATVIEGLGVDG